MRNPSYTGIVDFHEDDDDEERRECPNCLEYGFHNKLGVMIWKGDKRPEDWDKFLSCHTCGKTYPKYEIERGAELKVPTEPHVEANPFDVKQGIVLGIPKRSTPAGKKATAKRNRERTRAHHKDKEIDMEIQQHGEDNVHIIQDSDP